MIRLDSRMFFDRPRVLRAVGAAERRVLSKFGAYVRRTAKGSLKPARQMKLSEMSPEQRAAYERRKAEARRRGRPVPRRPEVISQPGAPPKLHVRPVRANPLRRLLLFGYDPRRRSVVIGPLAFRGHGAEKLEYGKGRHRARPFMRPALGKELPGLPAMWRDSVRGH